VKNKKCIAVVGPTAGGKTAHAIHLAEKLASPIVSFDSRQFYQELNIGVARPTKEELSLAHHHFIASHSIHDPLSAGKYAEQAWPKLLEMLKERDEIVLVGGSGLFLKVLLDGLDPLPQDEALRLELNQLLETQGIETLQQELLDKDPEYAKQVDLQNPHRLIRALEVIRLSGKKFSELRTQNKKSLPFEIEYHYVLPDKELLHQRIDMRVDLMMEMGLMDEAESLYHLKDIQPLNTVGYKELFEHKEGLHTLSEAIEWIKIHTKQYAKRQITWFNKELKNQEYKVIQPH
jgi:tRNA dimethylallyltransferase